jgi:Fe-S-cluster containining protein
MTTYYTPDKKKKNVFYKFDLTGECDFTRCNSACCRFRITDTLPHPPTTEKDASRLYFLLMRHGKMTYMGEHSHVIIEIPCPQLLPDGTCKIYNSRPLECQSWPTPGDQLHRYCREELPDGENCTLEISNVSIVKDKKLIAKLKKAQQRDGTNGTTT